MLRFRNAAEETSKENTTVSSSPSDAEFAQALSAVELRQREERTRVANEEARRATLTELGDEVSEEAVLAEVFRQRTAQEQQKRRLGQRRRTTIGAIAVLSCLAVGVYGAVHMRTAQGPLDSVALASLRETAPPKTHAWSLPPETLVISQTANGPQIRTLAEVPDGEMVEVAYKDLYVGERESASALTSWAKAGDTWHVVKYGGRPYLRGYLPVSLSEDALRRGNIWIANRPHGEIQVLSTKAGQEDIRIAMDKPTPVTLPLEGVQEDDGGMQDNGFQYAHITGTVPTDAHLHESWSNSTKTPPR